MTALYEIALKDSEFAKSLEIDLRYPGNKSASEKEGKATEPASAESAASDSGEIAFVKLRYKEPDGQSSKELTLPVTSEQLKDLADSASADFKFAASVAAFGSKLRASKYAETASYSEIAKVAKANLGEDKEGYRREFVELVESVGSLQK